MPSKPAKRRGRRAEDKITLTDLIENTDWGHELDRRHQANIEHFEAIDMRLGSIEAGQTTIQGALAENTRLTKQLMEDTDPYVKLRRAFLAGNEKVDRFGKFGMRVADALLRLGKAGAVVLVIYIAGQALIHGTSPRDALRMLWFILTQ